MQSYHAEPAPSNVHMHGRVGNQCVPRAVRYGPDLLFLGLGGSSATFPSSRNLLHFERERSISCVRRILLIVHGHGAREESSLDSSKAVVVLCSPHFLCVPQRRHPLGGGGIRAVGLTHSSRIAD